MSDKVQYERLFNSVLIDPELQPLTKFKKLRAGSIMYPEAVKYPDFFKNNLVSPGRLIKVVRGPSAMLKAFYYQLMKLTFELETLEKDYVQIFKSVLFNPLLKIEQQEQSPRSGRTCTDKQYQRVIAEMVELLLKQGIPNFQFTVMQYPIIDQALTRMFELLITLYFDKHATQSEQLQWLSRLFCINMEKYGRCYKFDESDIFLYEQNEQQYYIAFLNQMAQVSDNQQSAQNIKTNPLEEDFDAPNAIQQKYRYSTQITPPRNTSFPMRKTFDYQPRTIQQNQINIALPNQYKSSAESILHVLNQKLPKQTNGDLKHRLPQYNPFTDTINQRQPNQRTPLQDYGLGLVLKGSKKQTGNSEVYIAGGEAQNINIGGNFSIPSHQDFKNNPPFKSSLSIIEPDTFHQSIVKDLGYQSSNFIYSSPPMEEQQMIYHPKGSSFKSKKFLQVSVNSKQQSSGTIYKQFTDTKVLEFLTENERNRITNIKKKYKGVHRRDLMRLA